jgi:nicotinamide-nucleotide amidase
MKTDILFVGSKFENNAPLREYILRQIRKKIALINSVTNFKENDNSLFLHLEQELSNETRLLIVTTKTNFSVIGKLLCTITADNQVLKENMLIPSMSTLFEEKSYLLTHKNSIINVLQSDEEDLFPSLLLEEDTSNAVMHLFNEDKESAVALLSPLAKTNEVTMEITPLIEGWLQINITSRKYGNISQFITASKQLLKRQIISAANVIAYIIEKMQTKNKKITFAESCTGGLLAYRFTKESGASNIYDGSLITYSNALKENWLAVEAQTLNEYGAVSANVVEQMSEGALSVSYADYAVSVSGIAGPSGGTPDKPVGTVFICARSKSAKLVEKLLLKGDRNYVQEQTVLYAVKMLLDLDKELFF